MSAIARSHSPARSAPRLLIVLGLAAAAIPTSAAAACVQSSPAGCVTEAQALEVDGSSASQRTQAVALYQQACAWSHAPACVTAGYRLRAGEDVVHDPAAAGELFRSACESGSAEGCNMLGVMYANGEGGLGPDPARSRQLYQRSCGGGWGWGCYNVAVRMRDGEGGPKDLAAAAANFTTACELDIADACNSLGNLYWNGSGVPTDRLRANVLYTKACEGDSGWGCYNLGTSYRGGEGVLAKDLPKAAALLRKACDHGAAEGCNLAGIIFHDGEGGSTDYLLAFGLFHKACDDGYFWGCHNIAKMYRDGRGIGQDRERASVLFRKACNGGIEESCSALGEAPPATAAPIPPATATPRPTTVPSRRPSPAPTATPSTSSLWQRNCRVPWKADHELVYTVSTQVSDGQDGESTLHAVRRELLDLVGELELADEPELEKTRQRAVRAIEQAPAYDNPAPSFMGDSGADMTLTPDLTLALDELWNRVGRRAQAAGEPCADLRFTTGDDGVMQDSETGLVWRAGPDERFTRDQAVRWIAQLPADEGWRLPTMEEVSGLYSGGLRPENMPSFLGVAGSWLWTASEDAGPPESWGYSFARKGSMVMTACRFCDSRAVAVRSRR